MISEETIDRVIKRKRRILFVRYIKKKVEGLFRNDIKEQERLNALHSDTFANCLQLLSSTHPSQATAPYEMGVVAAGWYESQITRQQTVQIDAGKTFTITSWVSTSHRIGTGEIQRIAVMETGLREMLILEQPARTDRHPWWKLWKLPEITNPPTIVKLKTDPLPHYDKLEYGHIDSGFATVAEIRYYRELAVLALQNRPLTVV